MKFKLLYPIILQSNIISNQMTYSKTNYPKAVPSSVFYGPPRPLSSTEIEIYVDSIHHQLEMFNHDDLINLIQTGYVTVDMNSVFNRTFTEEDVFVLFTADANRDCHYLPTRHSSVIMVFLYFHDSQFPSNDEESPLSNPHWKDIVSMSCADLISRIVDYMFPMFTDAFEISFIEYQYKILA